MKKIRLPFGEPNQTNHLIPKWRLLEEVYLKIEEMGNKVTVYNFRHIYRDTYQHIASTWKEEGKPAIECITDEDGFIINEDDVNKQKKTLNNVVNLDKLIPMMRKWLLKEEAIFNMMNAVGEGRGTECDGSGNQLF